MQKALQVFKQQTIPRQVLLIGWLVLMLLLPFHAFISTWGGTAIGPLEIWKSWKEILLGLLLVPALMLLVKEKDLQKYLVSSWLIRLIALYTLIHLIIAFSLRGEWDATLYGLAINLRFLAFFIIGVITFWKVAISRKAIAWIVLLPTAAVVVFGLLQMFVLPTDFLSHFGYQKGVTIDPMINIDEQPDQIRIMSTLRGPNPLGAYLILPGTLLLGFLLSAVDWTKKKVRLERRHIFAISLFGLLLIALYGSHGRSSWLGFAVAMAVLILLYVPKKLRIILVAAGAATLLIAGGVVYQLRDTSFVQTVILHDNPETGAELTSNQAHGQAIEQGLEDVKNEPLIGCGPGCAGPASFYETEGPRLAENYFIQIAQEVGLIGLALFLAINALVLKKLYQHKDESVALALLAAFIGITVANLLLHVWADDTLAYVWWGMAGALFSRYSHSDLKTATSKRLRTSE